MTDPPMDAGRSPEADLVARLRAAGCVFAEDEARLLTEATDSAGALRALVARRVAGEPLEHVLGWAQFCGTRIAVDPGVFVPRRRTELLVREAVALLRASAGAGRRDDHRSPASGRPGDAPAPGAGRPGDAATPGGRPGGTGSSGPVLVDLCCGSGAVAVAVARAVGPLQVHAADVDPVAVRCARRNLRAVGGVVHRGDLYGALPLALVGRVDVLVANAPYVPTDAIALLPPEARAHEPHVALDGGADGLDIARRVVEGAGRWLAPRGSVVVETSRAQAPALVDAVRAAGMLPRVSRSERLGGTAVVASRR